MNRNSAVSPVIGVLLMLTLTLIIAAVVNSYAGGLVETKDKPPSVTLQAAFHQSTPDDPNNARLTISHISGDPLPVSEISVILKPTKTFGADADNQFREINKSYIRQSINSSQTWAEGVTSMKVGDTYGIFGAENITKVYDPYTLTNGTYRGNTFYLEFYYDRNLIAKPEVLIQS